MIKKLFLLTIIFLGIFQIWNVFADSDDFEDLNSRYDKEEYLSQDELSRLSGYKNEYGQWDDAVSNMRKDEEIAAKNEQRDKDCDPEQWWSWDCIDKKTFMFDTGSGFWIGPNFRWSNTSEWANVLLGTIIQKLMVALGVLSVLIMTVGWGYIILYHGQDELLSKGKSIFMSWIIALVIALSSYMIVGLLRFILYNN